jgi:hypothetical protein
MNYDLFFVIWNGVYLSFGKVMQNFYPFSEKHWAEWREKEVGLERRSGMGARNYWKECHHRHYG